MHNPSDKVNNNSCNGPCKITTFDKLSKLCTDLENSIQNMKSSTDFLGSEKESKNLVEEAIAEIRNEAYKCSSPEAEYAILLFQKFNKDLEAIRRKENTAMLHLFASTNSPILVESNRVFLVLKNAFDEINVDTFAGTDTFEKSIFWFRTIVSITAIAVIILINTTDTVMKKDSLSGYDFESSCMKNPTIRASFLILMTPYQLLYYAALCILSTNTSICLYYSLPLNQYNEKYIPSSNEVLRRLPTSSNDTLSFGGNEHNSISNLNYHWQCLEAFIDWLLLIFLITMFVQGVVAANVLFEVTLTFTDENDNTMGFALTSFYTITTFYNTFASHSWGTSSVQEGSVSQADMYPNCIQTNPIPNITAALIAMGIIIFFQCAIFRISLKSYMMHAMNQEFTRSNTNASSLLFSSLNSSEESDVEEEIKCRDLNQMHTLSTQNPCWKGDENIPAEPTTHTQINQSAFSPIYCEISTDCEQTDQSSASTMDTVLQYLVKDMGATVDMEETHQYEDFRQSCPYQDNCSEEDADEMEV